MTHIKLTKLLINKCLLNDFHKHGFVRGCSTLNYYQILDVANDATAKDIKKAYIKQCKKVNILKGQFTLRNIQKKISWIDIFGM